MAIINEINTKRQVHNDNFDRLKLTKHTLTESLSLKPIETGNGMF